MKLQARTMEINGTSYEIGTVLGKMTASIPALKANFTAGFEGIDQQATEKASNMFARWCPGLNEELQGFADALEVPLQQIIYYGMTYLRPNCSQIALLPSMTKSGHPLLARNYEFNHEAEDFTLFKTGVTGKYAHIGTSVLQFGREEGLNECGLAVTMSSCGFPVGPLEYMRKPALTGLQFWAVIRTLLENCKDVNEALEWLKDMPIAFNLNLMLMDKSGDTALFETLDGHKAVKRVTQDKQEQYLCATNHPVLPELIGFEPRAMRHSLQRYEWIRKQLDKAKELTVNDLKEMLLANYPEGLCCHYYEEFFGTTKSLVLDPVSKTIHICWGGEFSNGWQDYCISDSLEYSEKEIEIHFEKFTPEIGEYVPLEAAGLS